MADIVGRFPIRRKLANGVRPDTAQTYILPIPDTIAPGPGKRRAQASHVFVESAQSVVVRERGLPGLIRGLHGRPAGRSVLRPEIHLQALMRLRPGRFSNSGDCLVRNREARLVVQIEGNVHIGEIFGEFADHRCNGRYHPRMTRPDVLLGNGRSITDADRANVVIWVRRHFVRKVSQASRGVHPEGQEVVIDLVKVVDDRGFPTDGILVPLVKPPC